MLFFRLIVLVLFDFVRKRSQNLGRKDCTSKFLLCSFEKCSYSKSVNTVKLLKSYEMLLISWIIVALNIVFVLIVINCYVAEVRRVLTKKRKQT